jgi:hypothetical protein
MHALRLTPGTTIQSIEIAEDSRHLEQLQAAVGGWIQTLTLSPDLVLVFNEEGKIQRLPINDVATRLTQHYAVGLSPQDQIVGTALIVGFADSHFVDAPAEAREVLNRLGFAIAEEG